jgi:uncharacterized protein YjbJ (UPF0337 family)
METDQLKGLGREAIGKAESGLGGVTGDRGMQAEGTARDLAGQAQQMAGRLKDAAGDTVDNLRDTADEAYDRTASYARQGADQLQAQVQSSPLTTLVLAAAAGYLAALFVHGRR